MELLLAQRIERRRRRQRVHRPWTTYLSLSEAECRSKLQLSRQAVTYLCHLLADDLEATPSCPYALPVAVKVTAALYFFATGSFQHPLSSIGGMSQSTVSLAIRAVTVSLVAHAKNFIKFPVSPASQEAVKQEFMAKFGFPGVLGVIDCTHVQLRGPSENALVYVNRKGTHSINIQVISDASCNVTYVFANYPASCHDSFILTKSAIPAVFQGNPHVEGWLLGDSDYPLKTWLMTPYLKPATVRNISFNRKHAKAHAVIRRTLGMLKMRFQCLRKTAGTLQYSPRKVGSFFVACCVLHNIAMRHGCLLDINEDNIEDLRRWDAELQVQMPVNSNFPVEAVAQRDELAEELLQL
ncbi:putative nuclease HARBI1 [Thalassophryne amazonica]|uniref:putative nuclease HARBI1 n=1 Tax=Thalassophryne amazonica TaxID=390379 RepID=UPI001471A8FD|nr:putative nuclease HARBI1 [Thalassophryne amazonica]XP_034025042.1 putative nuclease HARBI1 [Thalassophryne amazonica]